MKILIISLCKENLHYLEFVKPIEDILNQDNFFVKNYQEVEKKDLDKAEKVIICGTSLRDNDYLDNLGFFEWIKEYEKPILGICAGMQVIGMIFNGKIKNKQEIGFYQEYFQKDFLGLKGKQEVYHLHNKYLDFSRVSEFEIFAKCNDKKIVQAVKHKHKKIYGVLFHPEVRQKKMILEFCKNG
jgi:GMP synthase (glutamine-hydrolysing)